MSLPLVLPDKAQKLLLHSCCAPCSGGIMETLFEAGIDYTVFFYNPNIHPEPEYRLRKEENIRFANKLGVPFVDGDYDSDNWFLRTKGMEHEPERGTRCSLCFDIRLEQAALFAHEHGFPLMSSSLGISRWKNFEQVVACGQHAAARYAGLSYWNFNWRKKGGTNRMLDVSKRENFYQQEYCGCAYSLRDANAHRLSQGRPTIKTRKYYGKD
ncbi:MAG: epoxyqueuosine reductase QueH [Zymomonas mobilis]